MDLADKDALSSALAYLQSRLNVQVPEAISRVYFAGGLSDLGIYEKLGQTPLQVPPVVAYCLVAEGFLRQPSLDDYYDIFRAARVIPLLRRIDMVLRLFSDSEIEQHRAKLVAAATFDVVDAAFFELIVAGTYRERFSNADVALIPESPKAKSPDILVEFSPDRRLYVECKSFNRMNEFQAKLRARVSEVLRPVLMMLRAEQRRLALRVWFECHPDSVDPAELMESARPLQPGGTTVVSTKFRMEATALGEPDEDFLYPSPKYFRQRFGYVSHEWHGILPGLEGQRSGVSFFESASWDAAVLWRIEHAETLWKVNKINYTLLFKGLTQLQTGGHRTNLHAWFERSSAWGHRANHLHRFFEGLDHQTEPFSNLIFNETHPDITPGGYFDFREHASAIGGPLREQERAEVTNVFSGSEDFRGGGMGGRRYPPIVGRLLRAIIASTSEMTPEWTLQSSRTRTLKPTWPSVAALLRGHAA